MNEQKQIKLIKWLELHTIRVNVDELGIIGAYAITDPAHFVDDLLIYLEQK